jgi:fructose-bisphosphate aldolase class I
MNTALLTNTARMMVASGKGLLAMDESSTTCNKRIPQWEIALNEETRCSYRELIVSTPGLGESISGANLHDETIRHKMKDGIHL